MGWTDVFPVFTEEMVDEYEATASLAEKAQLDEWYDSDYVINDQPACADIVSVSLFWKNVRLGDEELPTPTREILQNAKELGYAKRFNPWDHYVRPLLEQVPRCKEKYPDVCFRVYLAKDLEFLAQELAAAGNEVHVMKHSSIHFAPGGLWRFLPFGEEGKRVTVTDVDRLDELDSDLLRSRTMGEMELGAWRVPVPLDRTSGNHIPYLPFMGCQFGVTGGILPVKHLMKAFTWAALQEKLDPTVQLPGCGLVKIQQSLWPSYGFDEYFMTVAAYPRLAQHGMLTFVPSTAKSMILSLDVEYVTWGNPRSELVYFPAGFCCGMQMDVIRKDDDDGQESPSLQLVEAPSNNEAEEGDEQAHEPSEDVEIIKNPRIAFLFLSRGDVNHPQIWRAYFAQSQEPAAIYAHCKDINSLNANSFLLPHLIEEQIPTQWASASLVEATLALIHAALRDATTTHFILVSESCVPVRPYAELVKSLQLDERSRMRITPWTEMRKYHVLKAQRIENLPTIRKEIAHFQDQWMCLSRADAETCMKKNWMPEFEHVFAADEAFFATVLAASGKPPLQYVVNRPITWTMWSAESAHPVTFHKVPKAIIAEISESGCFFARKFAPNSDIGNYALHLP
jgi:Core-2/I-Branching enzyme